MFGLGSWLYCFSFGVHGSVLAYLFIVSQCTRLFVLGILSV